MSNSSENLITEILLKEVLIEGHEEFICVTEPYVITKELIKEKRWGD